MSTTATTQVRGSLTSAIEQSRGLARTHPLLIWLLLIGVFSPPIMISVGGVNLTPGRLVVILFMVPAFVRLLGHSRHGVASDFFAVAAATWILIASALSDGFRPYVGAE